MTDRLVVLGAGYTGLAAAKLAARWTDLDVTLVNATDRFVERVRLHQLATGQRLHDHRITDLLAGTGIEFVVGRVTGIDPAARTVHLADGTDLRYDLLAYALGSTADTESVPGVDEHAFPLASADQAMGLRDRLAASRVVTVAGGGLTGIEAATELAESRPDLKVRLVTSGVFGGALSDRGRRHLRRVFDRLGIDVVDGVRISEVRADGLVLADGAHLAADTVVWTTGFRVPDVARAAGFAVDERGRMLVDDTLRSVSHPEVIALGDTAVIRVGDGRELRMACATGLPTTQQAIRALAARRAGREPKPVRFRYLNQCISLGRRDGLVQFTHGDDSPRSVVLTGRIAARYKETIVRGTVLFERHPTIPAGV